MTGKMHRPLTSGTNVEPYENQGHAEDKFFDNQLIDFMLQHPGLMNRAIVVTPPGTL
jgi:arsenate reductase